LRLEVASNIEVLIDTENETCDFAAFDVLVAQGDTPSEIDLSVASDGSGGAQVQVQGAPTEGAILRALIPEKFGIQVVTAGGDITVARLEGRASIATAGGRISMDKISEGPINLASTGGDMNVRVINCNAEIDTQGGDFQSKRMQGLAFTLQTGEGDIDVGAMYADTIEVETTSGLIQVGSIHAETKLSSHSGAIRVKTGADGDLNVKTELGNVDVQLGMSIARVEVASQEGDIKLSAPLKFAAHPVHLHSKLGVQIDPAFTSQVEYDGATATGRIGDKPHDDTGRGFVPKTVEILAKAPAGRVEVMTQGWLASLGFKNMPTFD